ncbi:hypothetical protein L6164_008663 [Bauhinia variegata]|uniref:Uncharacterized protein n=1 Tax=Bauhinia variegata TaxID=167791 RepID=A0ACB9PHB7_BAUVA|nr:hypothetical protein L6164_008663 [Bauhinia variegata]
MNESLLAPFTKEEIKHALFQMGATKAPSPDGFPAIFYQQFWDDISQAITTIVLEFLNNNSPTDEINFTHIVLIPKVASPVNMTQFRPISLCNVVYNIIAKVLANRRRYFFQILYLSTRVPLYRIAKLPIMCCLLTSFYML